MYIFTSECYFCQFLTHISVDIVSFWGFRFGEKLKDKHTDQIFIYKSWGIANCVTVVLIPTVQI